MTTVEERMQILKMIEEGKITAEEGAKLLAALAAGSKPDASRREAGGSAGPRQFRVRVTDLATGRNKVNINIPMGLVNVGLKMGARFAPEVEGINFDEVMAAIKSGSQGKVVDVVDEEDGERVEIYVE
jgi:hypothetical protein